MLRIYVSDQFIYLIHKCHVTWILKEKGCLGVAQYLTRVETLSQFTCTLLSLNRSREGPAQINYVCVCLFVCVRHHLNAYFSETN